ncbi:bifunctional RNase H/acid phosphatase [Calidifontibacter sp. DB0510]|uniref:Bifunctional RNase H/acid phosphatase n=1 Tax=Metallococcus carri TaxID=1656884 RepID=A0A967B9J7_9MICO|nr:bifunctional RNase H/acid phosphatase [Metallococcus carri]NHN57356.1 bifunctional RNase H/acid phosphatase [Metallococcus carri]NOP39134.1 bifunctional RNase H/acid phosphatase [Calidifontibacter sp. DB2511S]
MSLVVEADGGSRGNPGVGGYGALVRDADGAVLAERAEPLGKVSNNVAEYSGLIAGLEAAAEIDPAADLEVRMDSKLVIEQMAGRWKIKHEDMKRLALTAQQLVQARRAAGGSIRWTWVPRAQNKAADKLSNDGMDGRTVRTDAWRASAAAAPQEGATQGEPDLDAPTAPIRVVLVRHGVTDFTEQGKLDGRGGANPDLNETGCAQAEAAAVGIRAHLPEGAARIFVSPLARTRSTAAPIARELGLTPTYLPDLEEQSFGVWDGQSVKEIHQREPLKLQRFRTEPDFRVEGAETHRELTERVLSAYRQIIGSAGPGEAVVIVSHRKPILAILADLLGLSMERIWTLAGEPASLTVLTVWPGRHSHISHLNDTHHLRG